MMDMNRYNKFDTSLFNSIASINERAIIVWELGELVDERTLPRKYNIKIYSLHDFFVEVWIDTKRNGIERIFALVSDNDWSDYLQNIKLPLFE